MLLITGGDGQLGQALAKVFPEALVTTSTSLDVTNADTVSDFIKRNKIDTVINCAAYTNVEKAEDDRDQVFKVNAEGPLNLAKTGARIIHISTDYVFDGKSDKPYHENDVASPLSIYGKSKLAGEKSLLECAGSVIIIRTSWLYSSQGNNFVKTILKLASQKDSLNIVSDQIGSPTFVGDLVNVIMMLVPKIKDGIQEIYHYSNEGICSWYEFAQEIIQQSQKSCIIYPIESKDYPAKASRPLYAVLDKSKIKQHLGIEIPHWKESLKKCLSQF